MQVEMILPTIHTFCILVPCGGVWYYLVVFWSYLVVFGSIWWYFDGIWLCFGSLWWYFGRIWWCFGSIWWYFDGIWLCLAMSWLVWVHGDPSISEKFEWPCLYSAHSAKHGSLQRVTLPFRVPCKHWSPSFSRPRLVSNLVLVQRKPFLPDEPVYIQQIPQNNVHCKKWLSLFMSRIFFANIGTSTQVSS